MPTTLTIWTGLVDSDFDTSGNWTNGVPQAGYDVLIAPQAIPIPATEENPEGGTEYLSIDCDGMHDDAEGAYNSVTLAAIYDGTVTLASDIETAFFELAGGTINQPNLGTGPLDTELTVTSVFTWTDGTLNDTDNLFQSHSRRQHSNRFVCPHRWRDSDTWQQRQFG